MIPLFCGYESRESLGFHVFLASVIERSTELVNVIPLSSLGLPQGSNAFTVSRFMVPYLMGFRGHAIFMDASDMMLLGDVAELWGMRDSSKAVQVVKHPSYATKHPIKYRGTALETINTSYPRKNWASVMIINCEHPAWARLTPENLVNCAALGLLQFQGIPDDEIGELPPEWNRLADEGHPVQGAKVLHWTAGIPGFAEYRNTPGADLWDRERRRASLEAE